MTVGQTSIKLSTIIDTAIRRTGFSVELQTPETIEISKNNLYLILSSLPNTGINLWCLEEQFVTLQEGKAMYQMPNGTIDISNSNYRRMTYVSGIDTIGTIDYKTQFSSSTPVKMIYIDTLNTSVIISVSNDDITYTNITTKTINEQQSWYSLDNINSTLYVKVTGTLAIAEVKYVSSYTDVPIYRLNKDDYLALTNKQLAGTPLQFWFNRQINPVLITWPVCDNNSSNNVLQVLKQRQIGDIGSLTSAIDIPERWLESICWQLARNLCFELPNIDPNKTNMCMQMAQNTLIDVRMEERDNSPISIIPNIGVYM